MRIWTAALLLGLCLPAFGMKWGLSCLLGWGGVKKAGPAERARVFHYRENALRDLSAGLNRKIEYPEEMRQALEDVYNSHWNDPKLLRAAAQLVGTTNGVWEDPAAQLERLAAVPTLKDKPYGLTACFLNPDFPLEKFKGGWEAYLNKVIDGANDPIGHNDMPPLSAMAQDLAGCAHFRPDVLSALPRIYRRLLMQPTLNDQGLLWVAATFGDLQIHRSDGWKPPKAIAKEITQAFIDYVTAWDAKNKPPRAHNIRRIFPEILRKTAQALGYEKELKWPEGL